MSPARPCSFLEGEFGVLSLDRESGLLVVKALASRFQRGDHRHTFGREGVSQEAKGVINASNLAVDEATLVFAVRDDFFGGHRRFGIHYSITMNDVSKNHKKFLKKVYDRYPPFSFVGTRAVNICSLPARSARGRSPREGLPFPLRDVSLAFPIHHRLFLLILRHRLPAGEVFVSLGDRLADGLHHLGFTDGFLSGKAGDGAIRVKEVAEGAEVRGGGGGGHKGCCDKMTMTARRKKASTSNKINELFL